jgi:oligopeptide/dipeptide ABC transporter ATP-binding protein
VAGLLEASELVVRFGDVTAVAGVNLTVPDGPYGVGLVGESGSGKTTIARAMLRLIPADAGRVLYEGQDLGAMGRRSLKAFRRAVQVVFQDTDGALDPRMRTEQCLAEVLRAHRIVPRDRVALRVEELLAEVGLTSEHAGRLPHQLSGGQRQRVSIARALAVQPRVLVLDEPTSALDVTVQSRILQLIERLRADHKLAYLLISHNLAVVERLCEAVTVLYLGRVVERGPTRAVLSRPAHPYTAALRSAVPQIEPSRLRAGRILLGGPVPDPARPPPGCVFHPRCPIAVERCATEVPRLADVSPGRQAACHRSGEVLQGTADLQIPRAHEPGSALSPESGKPNPLAPSL